MICYSIGYSGGNAVLDKIMDYYPKSRKGIESTRRFIDNMRRFQLELDVSFRYFARIFRLWQELRNKT